MQNRREEAHKLRDARAYPSGPFAIGHDVPRARCVRVSPHLHIVGSFAYRRRPPLRRRARDLVSFFIRFLDLFFSPRYCVAFFFVILSLFFYLFQFWINDNRVAPLASTEFRSRCARFFFLVYPFFGWLLWLFFLLLLFRWEEWRICMSFACQQEKAGMGALAATTLSIQSPPSETIAAILGPPSCWFNGSFNYLFRLGLFYADSKTARLPWRGFFCDILLPTFICFLTDFFSREEGGEGKIRNQRPRLLISLLGLFGCWFWKKKS